MDPPLISEGSFTTANPSLAEIWPFSNGGDSDNGGMLGLRMGSGGAGGFMNALLDGLLSNGVTTNRDGSIEESTITDQSGSLGVGVASRKRRDNVSEDESSKLVSTTSSANDLKGSNGKRIKTSSSQDENGSSKAGGEASSAGGNATAEKPAEPPKDYIHVRARRGQATDSHSLAERARREKISERMKILQDLVPGCNKVIGKALVLDEIINYIQSLQRQVEFLSMKLEAVNSGMTPSTNGFHSKDVIGKALVLDEIINYIQSLQRQVEFLSMKLEAVNSGMTPSTNGFHSKDVSSFDASGMMFSAQAAREFVAAATGGGQQSEWLHMQLGGSFERTT